jgi:hypothetical protein
VGEAKRLELCVLLNRQPDAAALEAVRHAYRLPTDFWWQVLLLRTLQRHCGCA